MSHKKDPCPKLRVKKIKDRFTKLDKKLHTCGNVFHVK